MIVTVCPMATGLGETLMKALVGTSAFTSVEVMIRTPGIVKIRIKANGRQMLVFRLKSSFSIIETPSNYYHFGFVGKRVFVKIS